MSRKAEIHGSLEIGRDYWGELYIMRDYWGELYIIMMQKQ
jgi:hypothetical protein